MRATRRFFVSILALAFVAAACGSDDDAPASSSAPSTESAVESTTAVTEPVEAGSLEAAVDAAAADFLASPYTNGATAFYVAVSDPEQGDVVRAYGEASVDGPAATIDDHFRVGSVTKSFTSSVILQLVDEGTLSLDDTVSDHMNDFAVDYPDLAELTIEQLLGMTSGVADYMNVPDAVVAGVVDDPTRVWGAEELIAAGVGAGVAAPGTPGYSTTNYIVLQLIAETVTGMSLQDLIAERLVEPLELEQTFLPPNDDTTLPDPVTSGYVAGGCVTEFEQDGATVEEGTDVTDWSASYGQGGGGMTSTIGDLASWGGALSGTSLLDEETAQRRVEMIDIGGIAYGLGLQQIGTWIGHTGEALGWEALAMHDPETGVTVALAANGCGGVVLGFAEFLDALYPDGGAYDALFFGPTIETDGESGGTTDTRTDTADESETVASTPEAPEVPSGGASGTGTFAAGDVSITGDIVECTLAEPDVDFVMNAENAGVEVYSIGAGEVGVIVSGMVEWEGRGQATIDGGDVTIVGQGSPQGAGTSTEDFTIDAEIGAC